MLCAQRAKFFHEALQLQGELTLLHYMDQTGFEYTDIAAAQKIDTAVR